MPLIRGPIDEDSSYYMVAKFDHEGINFYSICYGPIGGQDTFDGRHYIFASDAYGAAAEPAKVFHFDKTKDGYALRTTLRGGGRGYITSKDNERLHVYSTTRDEATLNFIPVNSTPDPTRLWTGVWYTVEVPSKEESLWVTIHPPRPQKEGPWQGREVNEDGSFLIRPLRSRYQQVMFLPRDTIALWDGTDCLRSGQHDAILYEFTDWASGEREDNCSGAWLTDRNRGCLFSSMSECEKGYTYEYCEVGDRCGRCMGRCDGNKPCVHDYEVTEKDGKPPLSCEPGKEEPPTFWEKWKNLIVIAGIAVAIVGFLTLLGVIGFILLIRRNNKGSKMAAPEIA